MQALLHNEKGLTRGELIMAGTKKLKWFPFIILAVLKFFLCKDPESDLSEEPYRRQPGRQRRKQRQEDLRD